MNLKQANTLFLDRDGVINTRIPGAYIQDPKEFEFMPGSLEALQAFNNLFEHIVVVTNQQGVGAGIMDLAQLNAVHEYMLKEVEAVGARIDKVYACTKIARDSPRCRKPNTGMGEQAKIDFRNIDFKRSIMVGDSISDIGFAENLAMIPVFMEGKKEDYKKSLKLNLKYRIHNLLDLVKLLES